MARGGGHYILPAVGWSRWAHALLRCQLNWGSPPLCPAWLWTAPHAWAPLHGPLGRGWDPSHTSGVGSGTGTQAAALQVAVAPGPTAAAQGPARGHFCYSPVLAFMVAGTLCREVVTAEMPTPYSVPGTRSVGGCRNQRYSVCASRAGSLRDADDRRLPLGPWAGSFLSGPLTSPVRTPQFHHLGHPHHASGVHWSVRGVLLAAGQRGKAARPPLPATSGSVPSCGRCPRGTEGPRLATTGEGISCLNCEVESG